MKKYLTLICTALLVALLALTLSGCTKEGRVKTAFKNAGYEITVVDAEDSKELTDLVSTYIKNYEKKKAEKEEGNSDSKNENETDKDKLTEEDVIKKFKIYTCVNAKRKAAFIKFPSEEDLELTLGETTFKSKTEGGYINGDCYLLASCTIDGISFYSTVSTDALYIFKNA